MRQGIIFYFATLFSVFYIVISAALVKFYLLVYKVSKEKNIDPQIVQSHLRSCTWIPQVPCYLRKLSDMGWQAGYVSGWVAGWWNNLGEDIDIVISILEGPTWYQRPKFPPSYDAPEIGCQMGWVSGWVVGWGNSMRKGIGNGTGSHFGSGWYQGTKGSSLGWHTLNGMAERLGVRMGGLLREQLGGRVRWWHWYLYSSLLF